jgi:hypothetical protein
MDRVPARSDRDCSARRSLVRGARRARPPPLVPHGTASAFPVLFGHGGLATLQGAQRFALGLPGTRGARPGGDPGPFDRCLLLTDSVLKELSEMMPKSRCTPQRMSHALGELPVHAVRARFGEPARGPERCLLRYPPCRRTSDASSPRGHSRRSCVHRRRPAVVRFLGAATSGRPEGLGRFHQAA